MATLGRIPKPLKPLSKTSFQYRVFLWMAECFGVDAATKRTERNHRFLEESLELVQACGCSKEDVLRLVDYVYSRPVGEAGQEVGGVLLSLAGLCNSQTLFMDAEGLRELERVSRLDVMTNIRAKQTAKPAFGPLPSNVGPQVTQIDGEWKITGSCRD